MKFEDFALPVCVLEDINTLESRKYIVTELVNAHETRCKLEKAKTVVDKQKVYIAELEQKVDDLQKALDIVLQNKCRTRKVKVKIYGRTKNVHKENYR